MGKGGLVRISLRRRGDHYEAMAADYLEQKGYLILARKYRCRQGEIDIVAKDGDVIVFVEVKGRLSSNFGSPEEAVNGRKQRRLCRVAAYYLWASNQQEQLCRFDVIALRDQGSAGYQISHLEAAFVGF